MGRPGNGNGDPLWTSTTRGGERHNVTDALFAIADALKATAMPQRSSAPWRRLAWSSVTAAQSSALSEVATAIGDYRDAARAAAADADEDEDDDE